MTRSVFLALFLFASALHAQTPEATILSYHRVVADPAGTSSGGESGAYTISLQQFDDQMNYLQQNGYHVIPLALLVAYVKGAINSLPPKAVVITVDDGWQCTYTEIFPDMQRRNLPFTAFIFPAMIDYGKGYLTWAEVEEMSKQGVDIEDHTYTHSLLTKRPEMAGDDYAQFLQHELIDSRTIIEQHTGKDVRFIAYPYSTYDAAVQQAVQQAGYEGALYDRDYADPVAHGEVIRRGTPLMHLKRFPIRSDTTLETFKTFLPVSADTGGAAPRPSSARAAS